MTGRPFVSSLAAILLLPTFASAQPLTVERALDALRTHEFGQHTDVLDFLRESAARSHTDPHVRRRLNVGFTEILQSDASYAARQFVCRLLVLTATDAQIPVLGTALQDPQIGHMALSVLVHLHDCAADRELIKALSKTDGRVQLGMITAMGNRRSLGAVTPLASLLNSDQPMVVKEAALALGRIGTRESATALNGFADQHPGALPGKVADAMLVCADNQAATDRVTAEALYRRMLNRVQPSPIRCAALNGLARLLGPKSLSALLTALNSQDGQLRQTAAQLVGTLPGTDITVTLAGRLNTFAPETQVWLLHALAARGDTAALASIRTAATHASVQVRMAALNALKPLGDESVIRLLADRAVQGDSLEQAAAKECLVRLAGDRINAEMVAQLNQVPPAQQVVLIEALAERQATEAAPALMAKTKDGSAAVRTASLKALGVLGSADQIAELSESLIHGNSRQILTAKTLVQIAERSHSTDTVSRILLEGLPKADTRPQRKALLYTLGQLKHDSALPVLVDALKDPDQTIRYNAIKALSAWPNVSPAPRLLAVAQTTSDPTHRILSLRGSIHLVSQSTLSATEKVEQYQQAIDLAPVAEKKNVLARLPELQSAQALQMAAEHLDNPATVNEAAQAATTLAQQLMTQTPGAAARAMQHVIESTAADSFKQKAQQVLHRISVTKGSPVSASYQALTHAPLTQGNPWAILTHDGASRPVKAYLSSLAQGETATGIIASGELILTGRTITFTLCGHDGQGGGRHENYMALIDMNTGKILKKTAPPSSDAMKAFTWDVSRLKGTKARIEVHDGNPDTAYAWLGVGSIDASPAFKIDFSQGLPGGWTSPHQKCPEQIDLVSGGVPFRQAEDLSSLIPTQGSTELGCGFMADHLFFLGCTVDVGQPGACYGGIELHYQTGSPDVFPLIDGYTLNALKTLEKQPKAIRLHATGDPYQCYLAITPRRARIEKIRFVAEPKRGPIPHITAITCETTAFHDRLVPLASQSISPQEADWIDSHSMSAESLDLGKVMQTLQTRQRLPEPGTATTTRFKRHRIDSTFRSEGVAVADFNGDDQLDIATGQVYYAGPHWTMVTIQDPPIAFNRLGYSSAFLCFPEDVDDNGDMDLIVVGFPGQQTHWLENPGRADTVWTKHLAVSKTDNESPIHVDVNGDGRKELLFFSRGQCVMARPGPDPRSPWIMTPLSGPGDPAPGHGLGVGDLNDDGLADVVIPDGWWQAPSYPSASPWSFHKATLFGGAQMCVHDFDGDGDSDVLGSSAHSYGIAWSEQTDRGWQRHEIDHADSQTHAIHLADINRDGLMDFVTGKRFWAHNGHDPGSFQPAVLCWYEQTRKNGHPEWIKHVIDFDSGVGLHFQIVDLNDDGCLDIVTSNKKGVYTFQQM